MRLTRGDIGRFRFFVLAARLGECAGFFVADAFAPVGLFPALLGFAAGLVPEEEAGVDESCAEDCRKEG